MKNILPTRLVFLDILSPPRIQSTKQDVFHKPHKPMPGKYEIEKCCEHRDSSG